MPTWLAALLSVAVIATVYFSCLRPMRQGRCATSGNAQRDAELNRQIAALREEVRVLRAQDSLESGQVRAKRQIPPSDA